MQASGNNVTGATVTVNGDVLTVTTVDPAAAERHREQGRLWREDNRERACELMRRHYQGLRDQVFDHYGTVCACCGRTEPEVTLSIDHIDGMGKAHREGLFGAANTASHNFWRWLRDQGFPDEGYQTLCGPCNASKGQGAFCRLDHEDKESAS